MTQGQAKADLMTGIVLFVMAVAVTWGAWTMDRLEARHIHPLSAPGLLPGLLGIALAISSAMLIVKSFWHPVPMPGGPEHVKEGNADATDAGGPTRLLGAAALCLVYALGLVGRLPFWLATAIFVTAFITLFEWDRGGDATRRFVRLGWALFLGLATGWAVSFVFSDLFLVRLP